MLGGTFLNIVAELPWQMLRVIVNLRLEQPGLEVHEPTTLSAVPSPIDLPQDAVAPGVGIRNHPVDALKIAQSLNVTFEPRFLQIWLDPMSDRKLVDLGYAAARPFDRHREIASRY